MAKKSKTKKKAVEPVVLIDPIYPLPPNTGIPPLKQGQGAEILRKVSPTRIIELPYRAFYTLWEIAESKAQTAYPHYKNGPLDHVSDMWLEVIAAMRSAELETPIEVFSEKQERKLRRKQEKSLKPSTPAAKPKKPAETTTAGKESDTQEICGVKHKAPDKKTRKCIRKPDHNGKHKDRRGNRY